MPSILPALDTKPYDRQYTDWQLLKRIAAYLGTQRWQVIGVGVLAGAVALMDVVYPFVAVQAINELAHQPSLSFIAGIIAIILFSRVFSLRYRDPANRFV